MQKLEDEEEIFKLGTQVEVTNYEKCYRNSWYEATIILPPKPNNPSIKSWSKRIFVEYETIFYQDDPSKKLQEFTDILLIRPLPPIPTSGSNRFEKHDVVDAYHKDGWFTGVILDVVNGGLRYLVAFLNPYEEFLYGRDEIRVHMEWLGGSRWNKVYPFSNVKVAFCPPNLGEIVVDSLLEPTSAVVSPVERPPSPAKKLKLTTSGDAEERPSSGWNNAVQSIDAPQELFQPSPLTSSKSNNRCNEKRKASDGQSDSSFPFTPNNEEIRINDDSHSGSPSKGNRVAKVKVKVEQGDCRSTAPVSYSERATTDRPEACPVTTCSSRRSDKSPSWPFTKRSEMWKVIESMDVFKRTPQMPHFSPLNEHEEKSREMLAICMMMKFSYEEERISAGSPDDYNSSSIILDTLKTLEELESHGFNTTWLQDYLTDLLLNIEMEKELNGNLEEVESGIRKCQGEKTAIEEKVSELDVQMKSLERQIQNEKSEKDTKDRELANLVSQRGTIAEKLHNFQLKKKRRFQW